MAGITYMFGSAPYTGSLTQPQLSLYGRLIDYYSDEAWPTGRLRAILRSIWVEQFPPRRKIDKDDLVCHIAFIQVKLKLPVVLLSPSSSSLPNETIEELDSGGGGGSKRKQVSSSSMVALLESPKKARTSESETKATPIVADDPPAIVCSPSNARWRYDQLCTWSLDDDYRRTLSLAPIYLGESKTKQLRDLADNPRHDPCIFVDYNAQSSRFKKDANDKQQHDGLDYKRPFLHFLGTDTVQEVQKTPADYQCHSEYRMRHMNLTRHQPWPSRIEHSGVRAAYNTIEQRIASTLQRPRPDVLHRAWSSCDESCAWREVMRYDLRDIYYLSNGMILICLHQATILWSPLTLPMVSIPPNLRVCHDGNGNGTVVWMHNLPPERPDYQRGAFLINQDFFGRHEGWDMVILYRIVDGQPIQLLDVDGSSVIKYWEQPSISLDGRTLTIWSPPPTSILNSDQAKLAHDDGLFRCYRYNLTDLASLSSSSSTMITPTAPSLSLGATSWFTISGVSHGRMTPIGARVGGDEKDKKEVEVSHWLVENDGSVSLYSCSHSSSVSSQLISRWQATGVAVNESRDRFVVYNVDESKESLKNYTPNPKPTNKDKKKKKKAQKKNRFGIGVYSLGTTKNNGGGGDLAGRQLVPVYYRSLSDSVSVPQWIDHTRFVLHLANNHELQVYDSGQPSSSRSSRYRIGCLVDRVRVLPLSADWKYSFITTVMMALLAPSDITTTITTRRRPTQCITATDSSVCTLNDDESIESRLLFDIVLIVIEYALVLHTCDPNDEEDEGR